MRLQVTLLRLIDRNEVTISIANWARVQLIAATHTARLMTTRSSNTIHILLIADDALTIAFTKQEQESQIYDVIYKE